MMKLCLAFTLLAVVISSTDAKEIDLRVPKIVFDRLEHDFGTMPQYQKEETSIGFKNDGTAPLIIERITATCGCTAVVPTLREVEPGKSSEIKVTFSSESFSGPQVKHVDVHTNDPANRIVRLTLRANILVDLRASSMVLSFGDISRQPKELTVRIFSPTGKKFTITEIRPNLPFIESEIRNVEGAKEGTEYLLLLRAAANPGGGGFNGTVIVRTDMEGVPPLTLTVSGFSRTRTEVLPPRLFFGVVNPDEEVVRSVTVRANGWEGMKVENVQVPDAFEAVISEAAEGREWKIDVTVKNDTPDGMLRDKIIIHINDEESGPIEVQVYALVRRQ